MCGICGIVNLDGRPVEEPSLLKMMQKMKLRGPDDEGTYLAHNLGLGFVRLSILDLSSAGHQPMYSPDKRFIIIFNGEIFNYIELRNELRALGHVFISSTDTEVLLHSYIEWGSNCLDRFNGMFAFVIYDTLKKQLFGARDRFGIKPFYYKKNTQQFIFASDIPPILSFLTIKPVADESVIYDYLVFNRTNHNPKTFFKDIVKLPHGHAFHITADGNLKIYRWYNLADHIIQKKDYDFRQGLTDSVLLQLRSDVPVGTCLSGGLDSSAITSLVLNKSDNNSLHSFSAVYGQGEVGDETSFIELFKDSRLNMHYTYPNADSLYSDLDGFLTALSEPVPNTSEYAEYKVMQLARDYCTVILNGQGADEMMAGYHYFYGYYFKDFLKSYQIGALSKEVVKYLKLHKSTFGLKALLFALHPQLFNRFNYFGLSSDFYNCYKNSPNPITTEFYKSSSLQQFLIKHFEYKFEHHLLWADKSGMHFSLETRFPFLDHNLVENTLSTGITIKDGYTKALMRSQLKGILPEQVRLRTDKTGYSTPEESWLRNEPFKNLFFEVLNSKSFGTRGIFNPLQCKAHYNAYLDHKVPPGNLWKWLNLELWFRRYID